MRASMRWCVNGKLAYRPKRRDPERWFAALDLFLYPARFEEFGMVVVGGAGDGRAGADLARRGRGRVPPARL